MCWGINYNLDAFICTGISKNEAGVNTLFLTSAIFISDEGFLSLFLILELLGVDGIAILFDLCENWAFPPWIIYNGTGLFRLILPFWIKL